MVFIYASVEDSKRKLQWEYLKSRKNAWGTRWAIGGDFNDILRQEDKQGGNKRLENSFVPFRTFVRDMCMRELCFNGRRWTWANNRQREGFIEERLDMFFTSAEWFLEFDQTEVQHILKQSSDHAMILLDTHPHHPKVRSRFIFDSRWTKKQDCREVVANSWAQQQEGSRMYRLHRHIQLCRANLLEWRKKDNINSKSLIESIKQEMVSLQEEGERRNWE